MYFILKFLLLRSLAMLARNEKCTLVLSVEQGLSVEQSMFVCVTTLSIRIAPGHPVYVLIIIIIINVC